ncbi:hypothetical protein GQ600_5946 [Phytophthora cactorum]|nr:hypothetical protein GQ600_5946 [Phytophthora cactorum]
MPRAPMAMKNQGGDYFYVRDCYDDYYHIILTDLLKIKKREVRDNDGNPGIGKAIFYAY